MLSNKKHYLYKHGYELTFVVVGSLLFFIWLLSLFMHGMESKQLDVFLFRLQDFFADHVNVIGYAANRDPYNNTVYASLGEKAYPAFVYLILYPWSKLVNIDNYYAAHYFLTMLNEPIFLTVTAIFLITIACATYDVISSNKKGDKFIKAGTAFVFLFCNPMLWGADRGNLALFSQLCVLIFIFYYDSENAIMKELALIFLAIAAGLKISPAFLGILLIYNKQWKEALRATIYGLILFFVPFLFLKGGFANIPLLIRNIGIQFQEYSPARGSTLYACLVDYTTLSAKTVQTIMRIFSVILVAASLFYKHKWEQVMAAVLVFIMAPWHSELYNCLYLIAPIIMFLNEEKHSKSDIFVLVAILLIVNPVQVAGFQTVIHPHTGLLILLTVLLVRGIRIIHEKIPKLITELKNKKDDTYTI